MQFQTLLLASLFFYLISRLTALDSNLRANNVAFRLDYLILTTPLLIFVCKLSLLKVSKKQGLGCSGVARHYCRNRCLLSIPLPTKMFQFRRLPLPTLCVQVRVTRYNPSRVSPLGHLRFKVYLATPRSLSQPITSFFGILRQGIHYVRFSNFLCIDYN